MDHIKMILRVLHLQILIFILKTLIRPKNSLNILTILIKTIQPIWNITRNVTIFRFFLNAIFFFLNIDFNLYIRFYFSVFIICFFWNSILIGKLDFVLVFDYNFNLKIRYYFSVNLRFDLFQPLGPTFPL